jgi:hypothetical protein
VEPARGARENINAAKSKSAPDAPMASPPNPSRTVQTERAHATDATSAARVKPRLRAPDRGASGRALACRWPEPDEPTLAPHRMQRLREIGWLTDAGGREHPASEFRTEHNRLVLQSAVEQLQRAQADWQVSTDNSHRSP